jgi:hypothetical protein
MNYFAVVVAAIAAFAVGALWYGPLFGRSWRALMNSAPGPMGGKHSSAQAMTMGFVATLVLCFVLAIFEGALGVGGFLGGLIIAAWLWLGFVATTLLNGVIYESRPWKLYFINVFQYLVALIVAAVIIAIW